MGALSNVPFLAGYNEQDQINRSREAQGLQTLSSMMGLQNQQRQMRLQDLELQKKDQQAKNLEAWAASQNDPQIQAMVRAMGPAALPYIMEKMKPQGPMVIPQGGVVYDPKQNLPVFSNPKEDQSTPFGKVNPGDFTPASIAKFAQTKSYGDLVPMPKQQQGAQPYYSPFDSSEGAMVFNHRTGKMEPAMGTSGQRIIKSVSDPSLQGQLAESKKLGADTGEQKALLPIKKDALTSISEAKNMLNAGIYAGGWGPTQKNIAKYTPGMDKDKVERTEAFISHIGNVVVPRLKEFGGNDSNEELKYLKGITGGDIALEPGALKVILDSAEMKMARNINRLSAPVGVPKNRTTEVIKEEVWVRGPDGKLVKQ